MKNGATENVTALYRAHVPRVVRLAFLLTGDADGAQDLAHDAFLKAAPRIGLMRDPDRFDAYLRQTLVRTVLMQRRSSDRENARASKYADTRPSDDGEAGATTASRVDLAVALGTLPGRQRAALVLRYFDDLSESQIASILGCPTGTVKSTLARGLDALRKVVPSNV